MSRAKRKRVLAMKRRQIARAASIGAAFERAEAALSWFEVAEQRLGYTLLAAFHRRFKRPEGT